MINLLADLQREFGLSYLFVAHDLAVVEHISQRIAVMYLGKIVELADKHALFTRPQHPYTDALLSAVPVPDPEAARRRIILQGRRAEPDQPAFGMPLHTRCPYAFTRCSQEEPEMREVIPGPATASPAICARCSPPCSRKPRGRAGVVLSSLPWSTGNNAKEPISAFSGPKLRP